MKITESARGWYDRIKANQGKLFYYGKWCFWLPAIIVFSVLVTRRNILLFGQDAEDYFWIGALLTWLAIGGLHYSSAPYPKLATWVSILDFVTLLSMALNFVLLFYISGRVNLIRQAEQRTMQARTDSEERQIRLAEANAQIANAQAQSDRARANAISNLTDVSPRAAARIGSQMGRNQSPAPQTAPGAAAPAIAEYKGESSTKYLMRWEKWIRILTGFECLLSIVTLGVIRLLSAFFNNRFFRDLPAPSPAPPDGRGARSDDEFSVQNSPRQTVQMPAPVSVQNSIPVPASSAVQNSALPRPAAVPSPRSESVEALKVLDESERSPEIAPAPAAPVQNRSVLNLVPRLVEPSKNQAPLTVQKARPEPSKKRKVIEPKKVNIPLEHLGAGFSASPDKRPGQEGKYSINRYLPGMGLCYLCRVDESEFVQLRSQPGNIGRAFIETKIGAERRDGEKKAKALQFVQAA